MRRFPLFATALTTVFLAASCAGAEEEQAKTADKSVIQEVKEDAEAGAAAVGTAVKDAARAVGHGFRDAAKAIGHGTRDAVGEVKKKVDEAVSD